MPQSKRILDPKIAAFHEFRRINSAASVIASRAIGTPWEESATNLHDIALHELCEFQRDSDGALADLELTPLARVLGIIATTAKINKVIFEVKS